MTKFLFKALLLFSLPALGQSPVVIDTLFCTPCSMDISVSSLNNAYNTTTLLQNYFPYLAPQFTDIYSAHKPKTEVLKEFTLQNISNSTIRNVKLSVNKMPFGGMNELVHQLLDSLPDEKSKALSLLQFVSKKHLYFYQPDILNPISENYNASKFLKGYGYGHCGMIATGVAQLAHSFTNQDQRFWYIAQGAHGIAEVKLDSNFTYLDADHQAYYLLPDNQTLGSFRDIYLDKYYYLRTKHFGPSTPFNQIWNNEFNTLINYGFHYINHTDTMLNSNDTCCPNINTQLGDDVCFDLYPNTSLSFFPSDTNYIHHYVQALPLPLLNTVQSIIGKGNMTTNFKPFDSTINAGIPLSLNIQVDQIDSSYYSSIADSLSIIILEHKSPLVISNGKIDISFFKNSSADSLNVFYSKDSLNWIPLILNSGIVNGLSNYSLDLLNFIQPNSSEATYRTLIKVEFKVSGNVNNIKINKIVLSDDFQFNKLLGPSFKSGINQIQCNSIDTQTLKLKIVWQAYNNNNPPSNLIVPIFPPNNSIVDSNYFTFKWTIPTDADSDSILDYQIQVSDDSLMRYACATIFDRYLKLTNNGQAYFTPEIKDYLNPNKIYYWRIKAMDEHGTWSEWSSTWRFRVKGPMYPHNIHWELNANGASDIIRLKWDQNPEGDSTFFYKVFGSDELRGFMPDDSNLQKITILPYLNVHLSNAKQQYRVKAYDKNGFESSSSFLLNLPFFYTGNIGTTFDYIQSVLPYINLTQMPFPPVNAQDRTLFCKVDSQFLSVNGTVVTPIQQGRTSLNICTKINQDTVIIFQLFLRILPFGAVDSYHVKNGLLITPKDTTIQAINNLTLTNCKYEGFINGDDPSILLSSPSVIHSINATLPNGFYISKALGAMSTKYIIDYQPGNIFIEGSTPNLINDYSSTKDTDFSIFPNPVKDQLHVNINAALIGSVLELSDSRGNIVSKKKLNTLANTLNINNLLCHGNYIISIYPPNSTQKISKKILIIN